MHEAYQNGITRRGFLGGGIASAALVASGCATTKNTPHSSIDDRTIQTARSNSIDSVQDPFVRDVAMYFDAKFRTGDAAVKEQAERKLTRQGVVKRDLVFPENINRLLIPKGVFLTSYTVWQGPNQYIETAAIYRIAKKDFFNGFFHNGKWSNRFSGFQLEGYDRYLFGPQIFATHKMPARSVYYTIRHPDGKAERVIGIQQDAIQRAYSRFGPKIVAEVIQDVSMEEAAHLLFRKPYKYPTMLVGLGAYRVDGDIDLKSPKDVAAKLATMELTKNPLVGIYLDLISFVNVDGKKVPRAQATYDPGNQVVHHNGFLSIENGLRELSPKLNRHNDKLAANPSESSYEQLNYSLAHLLQTKGRETLIDFPSAGR